MSTSWIYRLRKTDLIHEAHQRGIDQEGTLDELRARIAAYLRNEMSKSGEPSQPEPTCQTQPIIERIRRWGTHYDGGKGAEDFLDRLKDLHRGFKVKPEEVLPCLAEVFRGEALQWYWNRYLEWKTWEEFLRAFHKNFLPRNRLIDLEDNIRDRIQKPGEKTRAYIRDLETMIRRHGSFNEEQKLERAYRNLRPELEKFIRKTEVETVDDLLERAEELEENIAEERHQQQTATTRGTPQNTNSAAEITSSYNRATCCWRCGQRGHQRLECRRTPRIFCSFCGTAGITTARWLYDHLQLGDGKRKQGRRPGHRPTREYDATAELVEDTRIFIPVTIYGQHFRALLDTGATRSYLRQDIAE